MIDFVKNGRLGDVVRIYMDDNISGAGFERKGIDQLRSDVSKSIINLLVVKDLSRLGRNNAKTLLFLDYLEENGTRVITYDGRYDSLKDNDTVGIDTWYNERYIKDISRKIRANIRFKIQKGEYIGNSPFGYVKSLHQKNKLIVNPDEAKVVRNIYKLYQEGKGYSHIAKYLNQKGCESPSKGSWNPVAVRRILCNRVYIGDTVQGISEKVSFKSKKTRRLPEEKWVITENTHEAIISNEEFYRVQEIRKNKDLTSSPHKGVIHLFRGIIFCGGCGSIMFARKRKGRPMAYICSSYAQNGRSDCTSHHIKEEDLVRIVMEDFASLIELIDINPELMEKIDKIFSNTDSQIEVDRLKKQLKQKLKQQEVIYQDRLDEKISEDLFIRMNRQIEAKVELLKEELQHIKEKVSTSPCADGLSNMLRSKLNTDSATNELIKTAVDRIVVFDSGDEYLEERWGNLLPYKDRGNVMRLGGIVLEYKY